MWLLLQIYLIMLCSYVEVCTKHYRLGRGRFSAQKKERRGVNANKPVHKSSESLSRGTPAV